MNTLGVHLHHLVLDRFPCICRKHGIRPSLVFSDDCHAPTAKLGPQGRGQ